MIPFGLGSGFEGGITTPHGGVSIDLRRMNQGMANFRTSKGLVNGPMEKGLKSERSLSYIYEFLKEFILIVQFHCVERSLSWRSNLCHFPPSIFGLPNRSLSTQPQKNDLC